MKTVPVVSVPKVGVEFEKLTGIYSRPTPSISFTVALIVIWLSVFVESTDKGKSLKINVQKKFNLIDSSTIYYENGNLSEETAWDITVPNNLINKVKKYIKENSW